MRRYTLVVAIDRRANHSSSRNPTVLKALRPLKLCQSRPWFVCRNGPRELNTADDTANAIGSGVFRILIHANPGLLRIPLVEDPHTCRRFWLCRFGAGNSKLILADPE